MTGTLINPTQINSTQAESHSSSHSPNQVFFCPEESHFYSQCLEKMVFNHCTPNDRVIEFGSGDGSPVIHGLLRTRFEGKIYGYELNAAACQIAQARIQQYQLSHKYTVHNQCFFAGWKQARANYLIANPPYIPAPDNNIYMPSLHGGSDGSSITRKLFSVGCEQVLSLVSAYSNPIETIEYAITQGYQVIDFMVSPLKFGYYSSENKVRATITALHHERKAFYSRNVYLLAGVLFKKKNEHDADLSTELLQVMTALS